MSWTASIEAQLVTLDLSNRAEIQVQIVKAKQAESLMTEILFPYTRESRVSGREE